MERKKTGQIQLGISMRRLVCNSTIQYTIINLHTKYDDSIWHSLAEIFDEKLHHSKYGKKENRTNTGKNKASQAIQSPRTVPFFLLVSLLDGYSFANIIVEGIVAFKH